MLNTQNFSRIYKYAAASSLCISFVLFVMGFYMAIFASPADYQQGDFVRIMYVHVPSAWMALGIYTFIGVSSFCYLVWKNPLFDLAAKQSSILGAVFACITLITGSLWGKPIWGTWWVWDARLTSMLILFFLYCGYISLWVPLKDELVTSIAPAVLAVVGLVNVPIVKYSVNIWATLHQGTSFANLANPSIHSSMLTPLILVFIACAFFFVFVLTLNIRTELYKKKRLRHMLISCKD